MLQMRHLYTNVLVFTCAVALLLLNSCSEECGVCPNGDDPTGQTPAGWFEQTVSTDDVFYELHVFNANAVIAVGESGVIKRTTDGGDTWSFQSCPTVSGLRDVGFVDENIGWIVGYEGTILKTVTGEDLRAR